MCERLPDSINCHQREKTKNPRECPGHSKGNKKCVSTHPRAQDKRNGVPRIHAMTQHINPSPPSVPSGNRNNNLQHQPGLTSY